jgi:hypothetical protein
MKEKQTDALKAKQEEMETALHEMGDAFELSMH